MICPVTPTHVPLQPLFIPCTWHTKSLLLHPNVFVPTTHSYLYIAFSITTLFSILYSGSCLLHDIHFHWCIITKLIAAPDWQPRYIEDMVFQGDILLGHPKAFTKIQLLIFCLLNIIKDLFTKEMNKFI